VSPVSNGTTTWDFKERRHLDLAAHQFSLYFIPGEHLRTLGKHKGREQAALCA